MGTENCFTIKMIWSNIINATILSEVIGAVYKVAIEWQREQPLTKGSFSPFDHYHNSLTQTLVGGILVSLM